MRLTYCFWKCFLDLFSVQFVLINEFMAITYPTALIYLGSFYGITIWSLTYDVVVYYHNAHNVTIDFSKSASIFFFFLLRS